MAKATQNRAETFRVKLPTCADDCDCDGSPAERGCDDCGLREDEPASENTTLDHLLRQVELAGFAADGAIKSADADNAVKYAKAAEHLARAARMLI
jgi:hypothetical protein